VRFLWNKYVVYEKQRPRNRRLKQITIVCWTIWFGWFYGVISAYLVIGGGTLTVPFELLWFKIKNVVGTSAACVLPIFFLALLDFLSLTICWMSV
jgi:uncharacterized membrane protein YfcA